MQKGPSHHDILNFCHLTVNLYGFKLLWHKKNNVDYIRCGSDDAIKCHKVSEVELMFSHHDDVCTSEKRE